MHYTTKPKKKSGNTSLVRGTCTQYKELCSIIKAHRGEGDNEYYDSGPQNLRDRLRVPL